MSRPPATVKFLRFNQDNPHVYNLSARFTREAQAALGAPLGINFVMERVRWETSVVTTGGDPYRINNNFAPFYARLIMHTCPDLRNVFVTRTSVADADLDVTDSDQATLWEEAQRDDGWLEEAARAVCDDDSEGAAG